MTTNVKTILTQEGQLKNRKPLFKTARSRETVTMYLFLSPIIIGFLWFTLYPTVMTLCMSFFKWGMSGPERFVGLNNYIRIFTKDPTFWISIKVTVIYTVASVSSGLLVGFILALILNKPRKTVGFFRTAYYIPCMIAAGSPAILMWKWIFSGTGLINTMLSHIGIKGPGWLQSPEWAMTSIIIMSLWNVGGTMLIFISGLKAVPDEYYESAEIDGAGYFRKLFSITLPVLSPVILYNLIMGIIGAMQTFTVGYVLTQGGPLKSTTFWVILIYDSAFKNMQFGYSAALAWLLFIVVMALTVLIFKTSAKWVVYGDNSTDDAKK